MDWSVRRAMILLVFVTLGGMSPVAGALGWRATGSSGAIGRAGKVEELLCM